MLYGTVPETNAVFALLDNNLFFSFILFLLDNNKFAGKYE
jgi:hypothetical protein